jgi:hypothetical protein
MYGEGQPLAPQNDARSLRLDPRTVTKNDFPEWEDLDDQKAERKLDEIRKGADLKEQNPCLPNERPMQDTMWIAFFLLTVAGTIGAGLFYLDNLTQGAEHVHLGYIDIRSLIFAGLLGAAGSMVTSFLFMMVAHRAPSCVVYTSLFFSPAFKIFVGILFLCAATGAEDPEEAQGMAGMGGFFIFLGVCIGSCVYFCYRSLIPFMIKLTEVVADVIEKHPSLILIAVVGGFLGAVWTAACFVAFLGIFLEYQEAITEQNDYVQKALYGFCVFVFVWGSQVVGNVCHVTYCGAFGRWYLQGERSGRLGPDGSNIVTPSLKVALTSSFGSICMGSFLIAVIRAVEAVVRKARRQAQVDNPVMCVILMVLECLIRCIGDILEYFNAWAYVQCAVRGVAFCDAARITYSMITCANLKYIISDLLLNSLVSMGALLCGLVGGLCGVVAAFVMGGQEMADSRAGEKEIMLAAGGICGLSVGVMAGTAALNVISSGVKTILVCWAEMPEKLGASHPGINQEFCDRIAGNRGQ